jgi:hypothetical protein
MINPKVFPTILIALDVCAAIVWATHRDPKQFIYWMAAGVLTFAVTWM